MQEYIIASSFFPAHAKIFLAMSRVEIAFPYATLIQRVRKGAQSFFAEPDEYKRQFTFDLDQKGDPDYGYVDKTDPIYEGMADKKVFFHYSPIVPQLVVVNKIDSKGYMKWFRDMDILYRLAEVYSLCLLSKLDEECQGYNFLRSAAREQHVLRIMKYFPGGEKGDLIGKIHEDKSFVTLHLYQSEEGLIFFDTRGKEYVYKSKKDVTLAFSGNKCQIQTGGIPVEDATRSINRVDGGRILSLLHGARNFSNGARSRTVITFFLHNNIALPW